MANELARVDQAGVLERVVIEGDLAELSAPERVNYYKAVCESMRLNPLSQPFSYIRLNNKLTLYAKKDCTDQLRKLNEVSVTIVAREKMEDVYVVTARGTIGDRSDESIGAVSIGNLKGDALANAIMKAETKAKRRVTLSICGLGWLDETETSTIPDAKPVMVDTETGEIIEGEARPVPQTIGEAARRRANVQPKPEPAVELTSTDGLCTNDQKKRIHAMAAEVFGKGDDGREKYKGWLFDQSTKLRQEEDGLASGTSTCVELTEAEAEEIIGRLDVLRQEKAEQERDQAA